MGAPKAPTPDAAREGAGEPPPPDAGPTPDAGKGLGRVLGGVPEDSSAFIYCGIRKFAVQQSVLDGLRRCGAHRPLWPAVSHISLVSPWSRWPRRSREAIVSLGAAGTLRSAFAAVSLGARRARRARDACCRRRRTPGQQFCNLLFQGFHACVDTVEFHTHWIAKLSIRPAIEENGGHGVLELEERREN